MYYNRFRYYDPQLGQYITQDPIGLDGNNPTLYGYVHDPNTWIDPLGLNVSTGAGRTHITYEGIKGGKPYVGYASKPGLGHTAEDVLEYRYKKGYGHKDTPDVKPKPIYRDEGVKGKNTARGLEQDRHKINVKKHGANGVANKQNPVGPNNKKKHIYRRAANKHKNGTKPKGCKS